MNAAYTEQPFPPSLWAATATPAQFTSQLSGKVRSDVAVIGAGFTGLSTALHLAEKGVQVCVLDAEQPGWGASGRNGGQVIPGLKYDPDELRARLGEEHAEGVIQLAAGAADVVFNLIEKYGIECDAIRKGWIQTAHSPKLLQLMERRARQWEKRGVRVELLDRSAVAERVGGKGFVGGWVDYRAGSIQPLSYVRGLVRVAQHLGVAVHGKSRAVKIEKVDGSWQITTDNGSVVVADRVVIATNGYTDGLWPGLQQTVLAANSFLVATKPLSDEQGGPILKGGEVSSDSR
ncbi:MAG TPA: FAD-dependent oxidoreductase, partial [Candidimonas sp.]|nr:FAD-dependent oxidoreductase [Candidimonas sp.]